MAGSYPSSHTAREKSHFPCLERYPSHCGTLQAHLDEAGTQHHTENMLIVHLHVRLSDRRKQFHREISKIRPKAHVQAQSSLQDLFFF